jgi:hypothetical protein
MVDEEGLSRAEAVAKRAMELAARAEELARQAHEVAGVDEQLAALEAELDALAVEEARLDADLGDKSEQAKDESRPRDWADWSDWADALSERMEALGDRLGELIAGGLGVALHPPFPRPPRPFGSKGTYRAAGTETVRPVAGPVPVLAKNHIGSVDVRAGNEDVVRVRTRSKRQLPGPSGVPPVTVEERDGVVVVEAAQAGWWPLMLHLEVEVPRHSSVEVITGGGPVTVAGTASAVKVETGGGPVAISDADGPVAASTGGGSIRVDGRLRGDSNLATGGGPVTVVLRPGTRVEVDAYGTGADTNVEGLRVQGGRITGAVEGGGEGRLLIDTGGGPVRIRRE